MIKLHGTLMLATKHKKTMPKKPVEHLKYAQSARGTVQKMRDQAGGAKQFYLLVHGKEPEGRQSKTFNNYVNRGAYGIEWVGNIAKTLGFGDMTIKELTENDDAIIYHFSLKKNED